MASEDCKDAIVERWHEPTTAADWKRVKKVTQGENVYRVFENKKTGASALVMFEGEIVIEGGQLVYMLEDYDGPCLMFTPKSYYEREGGAHSDQHWEGALTAIYGIPEWIAFDEVTENTFMADDGHTVEEIAAVLDAMGLERVQPRK